MASGGSAVVSGAAEEERHGGTHLTDSPGPEAGVPAENQKNSEDSAEGDEDRVKVCQFFLMGKCRFGQRCRLSHSEPPADDSGCQDSDDKQDGEKTEKHKKKKGGANKAVKPKYSERREVNKKPRMRTADDVISRILWDPSVEAADFVVGYVDRFLGVLERPFSDFNWDTDPCDCDYASELALPRHRIQYFTHRGHRVWDRHTRTDRVFGSTGQPLAPPFGQKEEATEEIESEDPEEAEQLPPEQDGEPTKINPRHLEEEENETNVQPQESAADRLQVSEEQKDKEEDEETPAEWEENWENNGDSGHPSVPLEKRGGRPPKKRPTHFVCFRANTPSILSCFQQLQEDVVSLLPDCAPYWRPASSLHVTLCLLVLRGPDQVASAGEILQRFAQLDRNPPVSVTFPVKLKHFSGRVLYLSPQPQLHLQQLNAGLQDAFRMDGLLHRDSFNPRYHLTLAKLDRPDADRVFEGVADLKAGKSLNFGRLPVNTLHLCEMGGANVDGFYQTLCTVSLR
ncbi:leukocyte receptor cluster member 9 isoform X1 [Amphiprion ocellaris]|uniref:C3H1-type domain-containing protein n=2 Tax=Amphiprion ocellaris TaxID=80972 RepID=A0A3Q1B3C4_AMPOC|nr:leukocyte receptor cluster member 9 isoform X1 [Amphiprion ocellaris]XP_023131299.1 leukocyte receptor cluster member 9 isoform X1 [Amphiprion ocellaris]